MSQNNKQKPDGDPQQEKDGGVIYEKQFYGCVDRDCNFKAGVYVQALAQHNENGKMEYGYAGGVGVSFPIG